MTDRRNCTLPSTPQKGQFALDLGQGDWDLIRIFKLEGAQQWWEHFTGGNTLLLEAFY